MINTPQNTYMIQLIFAFFSVLYDASCFARPYGIMNSTCYARFSASLLKKHESYILLLQFVPTLYAVLQCASCFGYDLSHYKPCLMVASEVCDSWDQRFLVYVEACFCSYSKQDEQGSSTKSPDSTGCKQQ